MSPFRDEYLKWGFVVITLALVVILFWVLAN